MRTPMRPAPLLTIPLLLFGCDDRRVEHYRAPKSDPPSLVEAADQPAPDAIASQAQASELDWTLPDGWQAAADTSGGVRVATFEAGQDESRVEVAITAFGGDVGGTLANINRWRRQAGLDPVPIIEDQPTTEFEVAGRDAVMVELPGLTAAQIAGDGRTWFVKMTGPPEAVATQQENFVRFVRSLRWGAAE